VFDSPCKTKTDIKTVFELGCYQNLDNEREVIFLTEPVFIVLVFQTKLVLTVLACLTALAFTDISYCAAISY
jgi:hypothetical protein